MAIVRTHKRENPFVQIDKTMLSDRSISYKAKGILAYLLSKPNDWITYISDLEKRSSDGRDSIRTGLKELEDNGYIERKRVREKGQFKGWEYIVYEQPQVRKTDIGKTEVGKSDIGKTDIGKSNTSNNNLTNNDLTNNESTNKEVIPYVEIVNYLNNAASTNYRYTTKRTQSLIKARYREGFTMKDFKSVIDKKCTEWLHDSKMNKFLRPETLFGTKFESYLNQKGQKGGVKENASTRQHTDISKYNFDKKRNLSF